MQLPPGARPKAAHVALTPSSICVRVGEERILAGDLFSAIKAEESVWLVSASLCAHLRCACRTAAQF